MGAGCIGLSSCVKISVGQALFYLNAHVFKQFRPADGGVAIILPDIVGQVFPRHETVMAFLRVVPLAGLPAVAEPVYIPASMLHFRHALYLLPGKGDRAVVSRARNGDQRIPLGSEHFADVIGLGIIGLLEGFREFVPGLAVCLEDTFVQ